MTAKDNVAYLLPWKKIPDEFAQSRVDELLKALGDFSMFAGEPVFALAERVD